MKLSSTNVTFIGAVPTIAAIDVGSNAIRLAIANANTDGGYQIVYSVRESVRLGQDVFTKGTISAHTIDRTVQTFIDFKQKLGEHGVSRVVLASGCNNPLETDEPTRIIADLQALARWSTRAAETAKLMNLSAEDHKGGQPVNASPETDDFLRYGQNSLRRRWSRGLSRNQA